MSDIDRYLSVIASVGIYLYQFTTDARNGVSFDEAYGKINEYEKEVQLLRAQVAEAETLRAERDELKAKANVSICAWCGQECEKESSAIAEHVIVCEKRPEHAMLAKFEELLHTVAEQARQLRGAREIITAYIAQSMGMLHISHNEQNEIARAWLAANAPAQTEAEPRFDSAQKYHEALEQIESVWISESVSDEHIAALKMYTIAARALNNADDERDSANESGTEATP